MPRNRSPGYVKRRPRTRFFALFVSDRSNETARLFIPGGRNASSSERDFANAFGGVKTSVDVPTITLNDLLGREGVERFDFLSMDIELAEPAALAGGSALPTRCDQCGSTRRKANCCNERVRRQSRQHVTQYRCSDARSDGRVFHDHKGFNWRVLRATVASRFDLVKTVTSPFNWPGPHFGTQIWFVARRRQPVVSR